MISVERSKYKIYLQRAEECKRAMDTALERHDYSACMINAVHCAISAADALCIIYLGVRHKGMKHQDAVSLFRRVDTADTEIKKNAERLEQILSIKSRVEYGNSIVTQREAEEAVKKAERLLLFVKERIQSIV